LVVGISVAVPELPGAAVLQTVWSSLLALIGVWLALAQFLWYREATANRKETEGGSPG
jgi:hypothetical protein